jgi:subtilase family serine protease
VINSSNKGSTTLRNGPDVSANANFSFYTCADQTTCLANEYGGTSFAAPMWAGVYRARQPAVGQQRRRDHRLHQPDHLRAERVRRRADGAYATDFHDITSGTSGSYSATTGLTWSPVGAAPTGPA